MRSTTVTLAAILLTRVALAAPPVRTMYADAMAREQKIRSAIAAPDAGPDALAGARACVAAYEAIVRQYPASGYSDNALWQAARLSLDAFTRFGQPRDKDAGVRLLRRLAAAYPTSRLARQVPAQLAAAGVEASVPAPAALAAPASPSSGSRPPTVVKTATAQALATITAIRRSVMTDTVRVIVELDAEVTFHEERISDPARVFLDLPGTRAAAPLVDQTMRFEGDGDIVRQVRVGRHPNNITRVVLDASGVSSYSVYPLYDPFRLVIDCVRGTTADSAPATATTQSSPPVLAAKRTAALSLRTALLGGTPAHRALFAEARAVQAELPAPIETAHAATEQAPPPTPPIASTLPPIVAFAPPKNLNGGFSIARQLGLGVSRIVIDAGHGGHDPGAQGKGVTEAELVLDVTLRLETLLLKVPGVEVVLTRRTDDFIPLPERTAIANREGADLFLSIHANASPSPQGRGIETYFLNFANNLSAAAVAARENAASGQAMSALPDFVKAIALNNKLDESRDFATEVQRAMLERLRASNKTIKDLGVKQAPFVVLIGAAMPSVLAEISFVTNPQEAKLLKSTLYRQRIAEALFNAIRKYQTSLRNVTTVAHQE
jgi:N-acetylmuramoyl-L-alanine amidase